MDEELITNARAIVDSNRYMTLATADADGRPWATPVWYATEDRRLFLWVSSPDARHSRNIVARPEVAIVVFDSQVAVGDAQALYMDAEAAELEPDEIEEGLEVFSRSSRAQGLRAWTRNEVEPPARHRLYRAATTEHSVLGPGDKRLPLRLG